VLEQFHKYCEVMSFVLCRRSSRERRRADLPLAYTICEAALMGS
jgi:hypothetical protein